MLRELLKKLKEGNEVVLNRTTNQYGETMDDQAISFREGKWYLDMINCHSSSLLGMGTCQCNSHDPTGREEITRKEAINHLKELIKESQEDEKAREREIAWLDRAIESL